MYSPTLDGTGVLKHRVKLLEDQLGKSQEFNYKRKRKKDEGNEGNWGQTPSSLNALVKQKA